MRDGFRRFIEFTKRMRPRAPPPLQSCNSARANQPPPLPLRQAAEDAIRNSTRIQSLGISGGPATSARRRRQQQYKAVQRLHLDRSFPPVTFCHIFCWFFKMRGQSQGGSQVRSPTLEQTPLVFLRCTFDCDSSAHACGSNNTSTHPDGFTSRHAHLPMSPSPLPPPHPLHLPPSSQGQQVALAASTSAAQA